MIISIIAAMAENRVIGKDGKLPWYLPADLKRFQNITVRHPVIMGRKTFDSIVDRINGPLPDRANIVLTTRGGEIARTGVYVCANPEGALEAAEMLAGQMKTDEVFVAGGAAVYKLFLPKADRMYLTYIDAEFDGDTFFPVINGDEWKTKKLEKHEVDEKNRYRYVFAVLERR